VRGAAHRIPDGCVARGWRFEVELTTPKQRSAVAQHFGARRFAYNWALAQVKGNLDARTTDATIPVLAWNLPAIRREWNQVKHQAAPWWRECSKEAYACGIADLVAALHNWSEAKHGRRGGRRIGFPRFKARRHSHGRVRFSTGAMRLEPDRRHIILPVIGRLRSKENTRPLERLLAKGRARILSMTLSEQRPGGRLFVSVATLVAHAPGIPDQPDARCGIDLGIGQEWAVISIPLPPGSPAATEPSWSKTSPTACGYAPPVGSWWTATPTRPAISVTGPDRSPTGMSSGVELPPRCRSWATTAGRRTQPRGRARPQKTTKRWRGPVTPEPIPRSLGLEEPRAGAPGKE
jgi:Helix-turn-helix domain